MLQAQPQGRIRLTVPILGRVYVRNSLTQVFRTDVRDTVVGKVHRINGALMRHDELGERASDRVGKLQLEEEKLSHDDHPLLVKLQSQARCYSSITSIEPLVHNDDNMTRKCAAFELSREIKAQVVRSSR